MKHRQKMIAQQHAKKLRRNTSVAEKVMWEFLRKRRFKQFRFRRQYPISPYIADFICLSKKLIIELDGEQHDFKNEYDARRTAFLQRSGYKVYRISNKKFLFSNDEGWMKELEALLCE